MCSSDLLPHGQWNNTSLLSLSSCLGHQSTHHRRPRHAVCVCVCVRFVRRPVLVFVEYACISKTPLGCLSAGDLDGVLEVCVCRSHLVLLQLFYQVLGITQLSDQLGLLCGVKLLEADRQTGRQAGRQTGSQIGRAHV